MRVAKVFHPLIASLALVAATTQASAETITVLNYALYLPQDIVETFKEKTGIDVELVETPSAEETMARLMAGNGTGFDVVFISSTYAEALHKMGLVSDLDHSQIPNVKNLYDEAQKLSYDPGNTYSMPYGWGAFGLCYRADLLSFTPDSWRDIIDPRPEVEGKYTLFNSDRWFLEPAQLINGFSLNDMKSEHLETVKQNLIEAKRKMLAFDSVTMFSKVASGEAVMAQSPDGWCNYGTAENENVKFAVPKEGSDLWVDVMVVPTGAEHKELAEKFIDFVLEPANHKWLTEKLYFKTPNRLAMEQASADVKAKYPNLLIPPSVLAGYEIIRDVGKDAETISRLVTEISVSN